MTEAQNQVFYAATLEQFLPSDLNHLILGLFWGLILLWMAWMTLHLVVGFLRGDLKFYDLGRYFMRASFLILFIAIIMR